MRSVSVFFIAMVFLSCSKENDSPMNDPKQYDDNVVGNWQWYESSGGFGGGIYTPETVGYNLELQIDPDSLSLKKDDSTLFIRKYFVRKFNDLNWGEIDLLVEYISTGPNLDSFRYRYTIAKDTLSLYPHDLVDAENSFYVRK